MYVYCCDSILVYRYCKHIQVESCKCSMYISWTVFIVWPLPQGQILAVVPGSNNSVSVDCLICHQLCLMSLLMHQCHYGV